MPSEARDSTLPPLGKSGARVCPRCRKPAPAGGGPNARCGEHQLAFVQARALVESGHDPLLGVTLAGRFTILERIGSGSMGSVYRARQDAVGREVALKIVRRDRASDVETKGRFEREARAVSTLKSPHTVTAFDFGEAEDGSWFLALEMLEGETLGERLRREGRLHWVEALRFAGEALKSLAEAHSQGIIHRDLKPDNLFLARVRDASGVHELCKILDFGIAKWMREDDGPLDQLQTLAGTVFGTPRYMSPEQAQGTQLDARSDLYSLGVLLFHMLTGRAPFIDDDAVVVMAKHIKNPPPTFQEAAPDAEIPAPIEGVVRRVLEKSPELRPASAEHLLALLEAATSDARAVESGVRATVPSEEGPETLRRAERRTWVLSALLALTVLVALGLGLAFVARPKAASSGEIAQRAEPRKIVEQSPEPSVTLGGQPTPTLAPAADAAAPTLENSATIAVLPAPTGSPSAASQGHTLRPAPRRAPSTPKPSALERKGNERYGRFD